MKFRNIIEDILIEQLQAVDKTWFYQKNPSDGSWVLTPQKNTNLRRGIYLESDFIPVQYVVQALDWDSKHPPLKKLGSFDFSNNENWNFQNPYQSLPKAISGNRMYELFKNIQDGVKDQATQSLNGKPSRPAPNRKQDGNYAKYNEPLGSPDKPVKGKYKTSLPPQTNQYYWDVNAKTNNASNTNGDWIKKSEENVDKWRDVPAGYLPAEYEKALEWGRNEQQRQRDQAEKDKKNSANPRASESTAMAKDYKIQKLKNNYKPSNPYYHEEFPLGIDSAAYSSYNKAASDSATQRKNLIDPLQFKATSLRALGDINNTTMNMKDDGVSMGYGKNLNLKSELDRDYGYRNDIYKKKNFNQDEINKIENQIAQIDAVFTQYQTVVDQIYGHYITQELQKQRQEDAQRKRDQELNSKNKEEGYDWFGFLLTVASFIPVAGEFAIAYNIGVNLASAVYKYEKGDMAGAGFDMLLSCVPGVGKVLGGKNALNLIKVGKESTALKQVLENNIDVYFTAVKNQMSKVITNGTREALVNNTLDVIVKKLKSNTLGEFSAKKALDTAISQIDQKNKEIKTA
jgi:hypothetical protein